jgi:hypothetical protein
MTCPECHRSLVVVTAHSLLSPLTRCCHRESFNVGSLGCQRLSALVICVEIMGWHLLVVGRVEVSSIKNISIVVLKHRMKTKKHT